MQLSDKDESEIETVTEIVAGEDGHRTLRMKKII